MKILLFACPDATHPLFPRFSRSPNLGLCMLAAMVKDLAEVRVADLVLRREDVPAAVREAVEAVKPDLVGISAMTFQYHTAKKIAALVRKLAPGARIALGGYHASLDYKTIAADPEADFDFIIRGEGEATFREFVECLSSGRPADSVRGLSYRKDGAFVHNEPRPVLDMEKLPLPERKARLWGGYRVLGMPFDCVETSRGCTMPCTFCSITRHYGRNYRVYSFDRVLEDVKSAVALGARQIFFVDDNITLDPARFEELCETLTDPGLGEITFSTQASILGLYGRPELIEKMARARFNLVFLGIENISSRSLAYFKKGDIAKKTLWVLDAFRENRIMVMGGFILGSPHDTREDVLSQFEFMRERAIDSYLIQILTPYPGTPLSEELDKGGYIVNRDLRRYNGFYANVHTETLSSRELDFLRWKYAPYYRDLRWWALSTAMRWYPWSLIFKEQVARFWELLREETRILLRGEEYAFLRYCEEQVNSNCFFGEKVVPAWPDERKAVPR
ncbi:MAG: radical SAM protein [Elusimicrobiota bacterium]